MIGQNAVPVKVWIDPAQLDALRAVSGQRLTATAILTPLLSKWLAEHLTAQAAPVSCFVGAGQPEHAEYYKLAFDIEAQVRKLDHPVKEPLDLPEIAAAMAASAVPAAEIRAATNWLFRAHDPAENKYTASVRLYWKGQIIAGRPMLSKLNWQKLVSNVLNASGASLDGVPAGKPVLSNSDETTAELTAQHEEHVREQERHAAAVEQCREALGYTAAQWAEFRPAQRAELYLAWKQDTGQINPVMADALQASFGVRPLDSLLALMQPQGEHLILLDAPQDADAKKAAALRAVEDWHKTHGLEVA